MRVTAAAEQSIKGNTEHTDRVRTKCSDYKKAVLTICGQLKKPGRPLSAILNDLKQWFPKDLMEADSTCIALASFFREP